MSNLEKLNDLVSGILGIDKSELRPERRVEEIPNWDSFNNLQIISAVEEAFKVRFSTEEILKAEKYGDVIKLLNTHGIKMD